MVGVRQCNPTRRRRCAAVPTSQHVVAEIQVAQQGPAAVAAPAARKLTRQPIGLQVSAGGNAGGGVPGNEHCHQVWQICRTGSSAPTTWHSVQDRPHAASKELPACHSQLLEVLHGTRCLPGCRYRPRERVVLQCQDLEARESAARAPPRRQAAAQLVVKQPPAMLHKQGYRKGGSHAVHTATCRVMTAQDVMVGSYTPSTGACCPPCKPPTA